MFWPYSDALAFSDAPIGYAPAGLAAQASPHAALVVYNLLFLFAYALAFLGAYLLARELGTGRFGGLPPARPSRTRRGGSRRTATCM